MLRMTLARFYGEKVIFALVGLCLPALLTAICWSAVSSCRWPSR